MPRKQGSVGKTKLTMLAIIYHLEKRRKKPYGYAIWQILKRVFKNYLKPMDVRNVYRHLKDLTNMEYIQKIEVENVEGAPDRQLYALTDKGRKFTEKECRKQLETLEKAEK